MQRKKVMDDSQLNMSPVVRLERSIKMFLAVCFIMLSVRILFECVNVEGVYVMHFTYSES